MLGGGTHLLEMRLVESIDPEVVRELAFRFRLQSVSVRPYNSYPFQHAFLNTP